MSAMLVVTTLGIVLLAVGLALSGIVFGGFLGGALGGVCGWRMAPRERRKDITYRGVTWGTMLGALTGLGVVAVSLSLALVYFIS